VIQNKGVPLQFPEEFFSNDAHKLSDRDTEKLWSFLNDLQTNPLGSATTGDVEKKRDVFAKRVGDMVVYWKLKFGNSNPAALERIDVLKVAKKNEVDEVF